MSVDSISSNLSGYNAILGGDTTASDVKAEDPLGREAFLSMLIAQLKNQDPLNPMQGTDFSSQLAQFSSLEQLFNVNDTLEGIKSSFESKEDGNLLDFIGKDVLSNDDTFKMSRGECIGGYYSLDKDAATVINIYNSDGIQVAQLTQGVQAAGTHEVTWDGTDSTGERVSDGTYSYEVMALNTNGGYTLLDTGMSGKITGVTFEQGSPYLLMGDRLIAPSSVIKVWENEG